MILTDREIKIALDRQLIIIDPLPRDDAFSSTSVDLTLYRVIREFKLRTEGIETVIDPTHRGYRFDAVSAELAAERTINKAKGYLLHPDRLVLGWTTEHVDLMIQARLAARVEGKSSLARLGLGVHVTAPTIHAGFKGQIQLEMINHGPLPIRLRPGMSICQLILEQTLGTPDRGYAGQFAGQAA